MTTVKKAKPGKEIIVAPVDALAPYIGETAHPLTYEERVQLGRLSVKNIRNHRDRNGAPLTDLTLYLDGKKLAMISHENYGSAPDVSFIDNEAEEKAQKFVDESNWGLRVSQIVHLNENKETCLETLMSDLANAPLLLKEIEASRKKLAKLSKCALLMGTEKSYTVMSWARKTPLVDLRASQIEQGIKELISEITSSDEKFLNSAEQLESLGLSHLFGTHPSLPAKTK